MMNLYRRTRGGTQRASGLEAAHSRWAVWLACVLVVLLAVVVVAVRGPWEPDELRYAQVVREMTQPADFFVLRLWGNVYTEKPPLYFWLVRIFAPVAGGVGLAALIIPVVLAACALLWLTNRIASRWYGERVGIVSLAVLVSLPLFLLLSSIGRMDMLLALFVTSAVYSMFRGYVEDHAQAKLAAFLWMGLGLLAKGPFGFVFPLAIGGIALGVSGRLRSLLCRETAWGVVLILGVLAVWLVPAVSAVGPEYLEELLGRQVIARAVTGLDHREPPYFYAWVLPIVLLPWAVYMIPAVRDPWRRWTQRGDPRELWLLAWFAVPLIVLSLVQAKLPVYLLPAMPPAAILIARHWTALFDGQARSTRVRRVTRGLFLVGCLAGAVVLATGLFVENWPAESEETPRDGLALALRGSVRDEVLDSKTFLLGGSVLMAVSFLGFAGTSMAGRRGLNLTFGVMTSVAPCLILFLTSAIFPCIDASQSWREVGEVLAATPPHEPVVLYRLRPFVAYYVGREVIVIRRPERLGELVQRRGPIWCAMLLEEAEKIQWHCRVDFDPAKVRSSPKGTVCVVRLSRLDLAQIQSAVLQHDGAGRRSHIDPNRQRGP